MKKNQQAKNKTTLKNPTNNPKGKVKNYSLLIGAVLLLTTLAYIPVFNAGFINWDDNQYVYENTLIRSFSNIRALLFTPLQGNYHPLTMITLAFNYAISGYDASSYHIFNLLLHLANTYLVFLVAMRLSKQNFIIAITTALLFGVHPMHVESVAWVAERKDVLYTFFFLLGLQSYINYIEKKTQKHYLMSIVWLAFSLLSKPAAVIFPLVLLAIDFLFERQLAFKTIFEKAPHFILAFIIGMLTATAQKEVGATESIVEVNFVTRILFGSYSFMMYCIKLLAPVNLSPFYSFPSTKNTLPIAYYIAPLFLAGTSILCFLTYKKNKIITFGFLFFFINIMLIMQFFIVGRAIIADRYTYMSYIGLFFILGWLLSQLQSKFALNAYYLLLPIALLFTGLTYSQASHWKSGATLWEHAMEVTPGSRAFQNRAALYRKEGNPQKAIELYTQALTYHDDVIDDAIHTNRGNIYFDLKAYRQAIADYNSAIQLKPGEYLSFENRGSAYLMLSVYDSAITDINTSLSIKPDNPSAYYKRGIAYLNSKQYEAAISDNKRYLMSKPEDAEVHNSTGICFQSLGNNEEAVNYFSKAISLNKKGQYYLNRSYSYKNLGNNEAARADALSARQLGVNIPTNYATALGI